MARRMVVVGASAGGVEGLIAFARGLPPDLDLPVAVVLHVPPTATSALPSILSRSGPLGARHARDREPMEPGTVYVAPPDRHLMVERNVVRLARGPRENGHRPAIDPLFRSAASAFGPGAIAVVLSGTRDDGAAGAAAVSARGGRVLVQDPADAVYASMPENAIAADHPEYVLPVAELPAVVARLAAQPVSDEPAGDTEEIEMEERYAKLDPQAIAEETPGRPAPFGCPACGGVLWEIEDDGVLRFRCRVGHAYGAESLLDAESEVVEEALWTALRALEERGDLARRVAKRLRTNKLSARAEQYEQQAIESEQHVKVLREVLLGRNGGNERG